MLRTFFFISLYCVFCNSILNAQEDRFYIRTSSEAIDIPVTTEDSLVTYHGTNTTLKKLFNQNRVKVFRRGFKYADRDKLKRTYFCIAEDDTFQKALLQELPDIFEFGESIDTEKLKIYEPDDYGVTSTIGKNKGALVNLDYYDFLGVPQAWYYTTGSRDVIIGISDGTVFPEDPEFAQKTTQFKKTSYAKGHGLSTAAIAAGQGNNGYAGAGVCYDCSIYSTSYGDFKFLNQLLELSRAGAKVINCSWAGSKYYETAQEAINEMRDNGTVIVATTQNTAFSKTKGLQPSYPGSYDHVLSVSSIQHRYDSPQENIKIEEKNGNYYSANIKYHLARTGGFYNNDPENGEYNLYTSSANNFNTSVDIVAPGNFIFQYGVFEKDGTVSHNEFAATSPAAPLVTGTIGLMFSLNPCLSVDEVNSIIKLTATNIDHITANSPFAGMYGAGSLHTGRAVKFTHDMLSTNAYATIENQNFTRWKFDLKAAKNIEIKNQVFSKEAQVNFNAKNEILISNETVFLPSGNGTILLTVDPEKNYDCNEIDP